MKRFILVAVALPLLSSCTLFRKVEKTRTVEISYDSTTTVKKDIAIKKDSSEYTYQRILFYMPAAAVETRPVNSFPFLPELSLSASKLSDFASLLNLNTQNASEISKALQSGNVPPGYVPVYYESGTGKSGSSLETDRSAEDTNVKKDELQTDKMIKTPDKRWIYGLLLVIAGVILIAVFYDKITPPFL